MNKPYNYDSTDSKQGGQFNNPIAGPYIMRILQASEIISTTNRPMMVLCLDIAQDEFAGHFKKLFEFLKTKNPDAKWPCLYRRCMDEDQVGYFKGDIKSIEESNSGFKFDFNENQLKNKLVGCVLGEKEINSEGKTILEPRFLCSVQSVQEGKLKAPAIKKFDGVFKSAKKEFVDDGTLPF